MITCQKIYTDIPFAHRQHLHDGHCSLLHGHNWTLEITFACEELDENGFVVDFGKLGYIRSWIDKNLDHACVFNKDDQEKDILIKSAPQVFKSYVVDNCSCEGMAQHLYEVLNSLVERETGGRVRVVKVKVWEDSRNSATYMGLSPKSS